MVNYIIFSFNRSCQLELLLRSIKEFFIDWEAFPIYILYKYSSDNYKKGYDKVKKLHPEFNYIQESNFKIDLLKLLNIKNYYTIFSVDDDVFKEEFYFNCPEVKILNTDNNVSCISLRLHPGINYCYTENKNTPPPNFLSKDPYTWSWVGLPGDWGYPMSVDNTVFRTSDIISKCLTINYNNPNTLEGNLATTPIQKPLMICFEKSKVFNIPINRVQTVNSNRYGNISAEYLNNKFLEGYIIDLESLKGFNNMSAHQEVDLKLKKE